MSPRHMQLCVEGPNDHHALLHLLRESGVLSKELDEKSSPVEFRQLKNKKLVIDDIATRYKEDGKIAVGYVVDADDATGDPPGQKSTWQAICHRLSQMDVSPPLEPPSNGFIASLGDAGPRVGVWIMPDNVVDGELEAFLYALTEQTSSLWEHVRSATTTARTNHGAEFSQSNQSKAELACWLAWQKEPAMKYGEAMQAGKFDYKQELAVRFIDWIRRLFYL